MFVFITVCVSICLTNAIDLKFPEDFKFGVATSAFQSEGDLSKDNKSQTVWHQKNRDNPQMIQDYFNPNLAADSYHDWREDIKMIENLGVQYYRFSIAWTRILENGYPNAINFKAINHYKAIIKELKAKGIEPIVTMYHFDTPKQFNVFGGVNNNGIVNFFVSYADVLFKHFGNDVKIWITINEPNNECAPFNSELGTGDTDLLSPDGVTAYLCANSLIKVHGAIYKLYKQKYKARQKGKIGISISFPWYEPASLNSEDIEAAERRRQFDFGLYTHPFIFNDYPKVVKDRLAFRSKLQNFAFSRLPELSKDEKQSLSNAFDFIGINHYGTFLTQNTKEANISKFGLVADSRSAVSLDPSWIPTGLKANRVVPWGIRKALRWIKEEYNNPEILITEIGCAERSKTLDDDFRVQYLKAYLTEILKSLTEDKVNVKGAIIWSLMDQFEWYNGYRINFGLYSVNFTDSNKARTIRKSGEYIKKVVATYRLD